MPYLPIDPKDLGRSYDAVIRVNSQSGKGGIAYLLETEYGLELPRRLQIEFSQAVQQVMDDSGKELGAAQIRAIFDREYGLVDAAADRVAQVRLSAPAGDVVQVEAELIVDGQRHALSGQGNGPVDAFVAALAEHAGFAIRVLDYHEHAVGSGADARAVAYLELRIGEHTLFGVGIAPSIVTASLQAVVSGLRRARLRGDLPKDQAVHA
jgi:2-isopropylmalate synthase